MATIKLLKKLGKHKEGDVIDVALDAEGVVKDRYWRRRVRDTKRDKFVKLTLNKDEKAEQDQRKKDLEAKAKKAEEAKPEPTKREA